LGKCELPNSGYVLPWLNHPEKFDNEYFEMIVGEKWNGILNGAGNPQYIVDDKFMMLNADLDLAYDTELGEPGVSPPRVLSKGPLFNLASDYAESNELFLSAFKAAFQKLAEKTNDSLYDLTGEPVDGGEPDDEDADDDDDAADEVEQNYYRWAYAAAGGIVLALGGVLGLARLRNSRDLSDSGEVSDEEEATISPGDFASSIPELEEEGEMAVFHPEQSLL